MQPENHPSYATAARKLALLLALLGLPLEAKAVDLVVIASTGSGVTTLSRAQVADLFLGKTAAQVRSAWAKLYFTGKGVPPQVDDGKEEIKRMVAGHRNMLGHIDRSAADGSVKIVFEAP
jgi:hypothetical protein